jgi:protease-4
MKSNFTRALALFLLSASITQIHASVDSEANSVGRFTGTVAGCITFALLHNANNPQQNKLIFNTIAALCVSAGVSSFMYSALTDPSKVRIGYLHLKGTITNSAAYTRHIEEFENDDLIKGLIIKVDSPGGAPGSSQNILNALSRLKTKKPIVAYVENCCASGAYYAICGANKIITTPSAMIGSIGVVMRAPNVKDLLESWQVKHTVIQAGEYKTALDPLKEIRPNEVEFLQNIVDDTYNQFIADVALQRGLELSTDKIWANGKIFTGRQALDLKLVDAIGSYRNALDAMAGLLNAHPQDIFLIKRSEKGLFFESNSDDEANTSLTNKAADFCVSVYKKATMQLSTEQTQPQV